MQSWLEGKIPVCSKMPHDEVCRCFSSHILGREKNLPQNLFKKTQYGEKGTSVKQNQKAMTI